MTHADPPPAGLPPPPEPRRRPARRGLIAAALLIGGVAIGAGVTGLATGGRQAMLIATTPVAINAMPAWSPVAVKGQVAEIFGNAFVLQDQSGRALVDTGPEGESSPLVIKDETVTVQGRFDRGIVRAAAVSHADGRTDIVGPPGPPHGPRPGLARLWPHWRWLRADADTGGSRLIPLNS